MATKRYRGNSIEYIFRRKGLLPKPRSVTFSKEEEKQADEYALRVDLMLEQGIVPPEFIDKAVVDRTIKDVVRDFLLTYKVAEQDKSTYPSIVAAVGSVKMRDVNFQWAEEWLQKMKREQNLSPSTIRHKVGALARCFDWCCRKTPPELSINPLRLFPKGYSQYNEADVIELEGSGLEAKEDVSRNRRLSADGEEERAIRAVMAGEKPRVGFYFKIRYQAAIECMFDIALETGMRMREIYTLTIDQIDVPQRTIFLDRTKNGHTRQVPMTTVCVASILRYMEHVKNQTRGMEGYSFKSGIVFPWWNGSYDATYLKQLSARLSTMFGRFFVGAGCEDFHFHDLRHEAVSRFYERTQMSDVKIMSIVGHMSKKMALRYANLRASTLATELW
ncbi:site-specific integrase [Methyloversatilis sp.]|uniref:site-specific integrase n=1 Tax=Methyloversatilis sp. TaxID=2569862 RepID=UPI0035ADC580